MEKIGINARTVENSLNIMRHTMNGAVLKGQMNQGHISALNVRKSLGFHNDYSRRARATSE